MNYINKLKGAYIAMKYTTPDFDVTVYEIEDVITLSIDSSVDGGDTGWWG